MALSYELVSLREISDRLVQRLRLGAELVDQVLIDAGLPLRIELVPAETDLVDIPAEDPRWSGPGSALEVAPLLHVDDRHVATVVDQIRQHG